MQLELNKIHLGDSLAILKQMADKSVHCIVTSPPYWGLRDYGVIGQLGLEATPELFIQKLVEIFNECRRVLRNDGTLWLNLGDSYSGSGKGNNPDGTPHPSKLTAKQGTQKGTSTGLQVPNKSHKIGLKPKDLVGIPWMAAFALRASGWYLRQDIIWHKPNPMPESVTDRCTKSHEYIFLFSKSKKYFYDAGAIKQIAINPESDLRRANQQKWDNRSAPTEIKNGLRPLKSGNLKRKTGIERGCPENSNSNVCGSVPWEGIKANKRSVWTVTTKPFTEAHFATFPQDLIVDCIKAGCPENGIVLDPFMGGGTTALVARKLNRNFIGIELNPKYVGIAEKRLHKELGLFHPSQNTTV